MSGDHNQYQKDKSYLDFECPRCGHCCQALETEQESVRLQCTTCGTVYADGLPPQVAQPEQEPVAFINVEKQKLEWAKLTSWHTPTIVNLPKIPLYTAPPKREWVGLTDEEVVGIGNASGLKAKPTSTGIIIHPDGIKNFFQAIEAKLKEKNHG